MLPQLKEINHLNCISVMELSSFQLMNCRYSPDVSIITNLSENHLDWHQDMNEYLDAKKNIMRYQSAEDILVANIEKLKKRYPEGFAVEKSTERQSEDI